jgi:predicted enzyme related to lactoylglutathione lyase
MIKPQISILLVIILAGCKMSPGNVEMANKTKQSKDNAMNDTIPKVTGIGGVFFFSDNPEEIRKWYGKNLGLAINEYGSSFEFRNASRPDEINYLQWSPFEKGSEYFKPSKKEFMVNYRVQNIEGLVRNLKSNGVTILDEIETFDYGKFIHILDPEGNKIELWEPIDCVFTQMGGETTK